MSNVENEAGKQEVSCPSCTHNFNNFEESPGNGRNMPDSVTGMDSGLDRARSQDSVRSGSNKPRNWLNAGQSLLNYMWQDSNTRLALLGGLLILPAFFLHEIMRLHYPALDVLSIVALVTAGYPIIRNAFESLWTDRQININVLVTVASLGAILIGAYTEAGMVMVLFALGEGLEGYSAHRARRSIQSLRQVMPHEATLLHRQGESPGETQVQVDQLQVGDIILVKPGQRIPMDGRVLAGLSHVNQAPITGESQPVEKQADSQVFASTVNGEGALEIEVTRLANDNTISRLIRMVQQAQENRAPIQRFIDQFARYYTPVIVALAFLTAVLPPLLWGQPFLSSDAGHGWLYRGLALLVIGCPCALVISTPVSIMSAISNGARNGVVIKGAAYLEVMSRVKVVAFDKTGTLTEGQPSVVSARPANGKQSERSVNLAPWPEEAPGLLALASAVERRSQHPVAKAIVSETARLGGQDLYAPASGVTALTGQGVTGRVQGQQITIGSHDYLASQNILHPDEHCQAADQDANQGQTPLMVAAEGTYLGTITVADRVRAGSRDMVAELRQAGIKHIVMLSGDNPATARAVGQTLGITDLRAGLMPEAKVAAVKELKDVYGPVAMVGDGINDAPALATADVGIAVGGNSSSAQAMETSDITLMNGNLDRLPFAFRLSRATINTIKANLGLAVGIKMVALALVLASLGSMWMAIAADIGTMLLVTLIGLRLLRRPKV